MSGYDDVTVDKAARALALARHPYQLDTEAERAEFWRFTPRAIREGYEATARKVLDAVADDLEQRGYDRAIREMGLG